MVRILRKCEFQVVLKVEAVSSCREVDRRVLTADADAGLGLVTCGLNGVWPDDQTVHPTAVALWVDLIPVSVAGDVVQVGEDVEQKDETLETPRSDMA